MLLCGPPGCGKTLTAEVIATELGRPLAFVRTDSVISSFLGETAANLRKVFDFLVAHPLLALFDEFDALGKERDDPSEHGELRRVVNAVLQMLDAYAGRSILPAATNHDGRLDSAVWRRFDEVLFLRPPTSAHTPKAETGVRESPPADRRRPSAMTDAILTDNNRKAELSFAYIAALAAHAGYTCQRGPEPDAASIDATIRSGDAIGTQFDVQLKATSTLSRGGDGLHFRLSKKNYNDLVADRMTPLLLVVLELPPADAHWLECTVEHLTMRRCGWWAWLSGRAPTDGETTTIVIPDEQRIGTSGIAPLMAAARGRTND